MSNMKESPFRRYVDHTLPLLRGIEHESAVEHAKCVIDRLPILRDLKDHWEAAVKEPLKGVTQNGTIRSGLFQRVNDGIPINDIVTKATTILNVASEEQRKAMHLSLDDPKRRMWSNAHPYFFHIGVRLEEIGEDLRTKIFSLFEATLSPEGFHKMKLLMELNSFLGELVNGAFVLNRNSYNFAIFGNPSKTEPWAWIMNGHHVCLSILVWGGTIVVGPTFLGAEPNVIDAGPLAGTKMLVSEQELGLELIRTLPESMRNTAHLHTDMDSPARFKPGKMGWIQAIAFCDNEVLAPKGLSLADVDAYLFDLAIRIVEQFIIYLPSTARENRLQQIRSFVKETSFCWIGGIGDDDAFYYRIQSPVIVCEFEHMPGVFLANKKPEKFHIHTQVRIPNGGDYGHSLTK